MKTLAQYMQQVSGRTFAPEAMPPGPGDLPQNQEFPQAPALAVNTASRAERQSG